MSKVSSLQAIMIGTTYTDFHLMLTLVSEAFYPHFMERQREFQGAGVPHFEATQLTGTGTSLQTQCSDSGILL